jgi:integrase
MKIFRRKKPDGTTGEVYWVRFSFQKKAYWKSLDTTIPATAKMRAAAYYDEVTSMKWSICEKLKSRRFGGNVGEVIDVYREVNLLIQETTKRKNIRSLLTVIKEAKGLKTDEECHPVPLSELNENLAWRFQQARIDAMPDDPDDQASAGVTIISMLRQARSLFSGEALRAYLQREIPLPEIDLKCSHKILPKKDTRFVPIPSEVVKKMEKQAHALKKKSPEMFKAYLLESRLAMRVSEIVAAKWGWIERDKSGDVMAIIKRPDFNPKGTEGRVPIDQDVLKELDTFRGREDEFIIKADSDTERHNIVQRDLSEWLRTFIPDRQKTNHELRKLAVSRVLTMTRSIPHAQSFARHADPNTTIKVYGTILETLPALK